LAVREPHKGAVALGITPQLLIHVHDVRLLLETEAGQMAKECAEARTTTEDRRVLAALDHDEALLTTLYARSRIETMLDQEPAVP
jgi:DNA-binding GntR family transcriptional regulator